jgi:FtsZ-interacting cell division protein YlmF
MANQYNSSSNDRALYNNLSLNSTTQPLPSYSQSQILNQFVTPGIPLPTNQNDIIPRNYQNLVIYEPNTPGDVEMLIGYLKRKEPAIINLDNIEDTRSQRVLDFVSGAIFALNGSVQRVSSNIFLLCPEGIQITAPLDLVK